MYGVMLSQKLIICDVQSLLLDHQGLLCFHDSGCTDSAKPYCFQLKCVQCYKDSQCPNNGRCADFACYMDITNKVTNTGDPSTVSPPPVLPPPPPPSPDLTQINLDIPCQSPAGGCGNQCVTDKDCNATYPACSPNGRCVQCTGDSFCETNPFKQVCSLQGSQIYTCVQCNFASQCGVYGLQPVPAPSPVSPSPGGGLPPAPQNAPVQIIPVPGDVQSRSLIWNQMLVPQFSCVNNNCQQCSNDTDCPSLLPSCINGMCQQTCSNSSQCPLVPTNGQGVCSSPLSQCTANCTTDAQCIAPGLPFCDVAQGLCTNCRTNSDCTVRKPYCFSSIVEINHCVECLESSQCANGYVCDPVSHTCVACVSDADCQGSPSLPLCSSTRECVSCLSSSDCKSGYTCDQGHCYECLSSADCQSKLAPLCDTTSRTCKQCLSNASCPAYAPVCLAGLQQCVQCQNAATDCPAGMICYLNRCQECAEDSQCQSGETCISGQCKACSSASDCQSVAQYTNLNCDTSTQTCSLP